MTFAGASGALTGRLSGTVAVNAAGTDPEHGDAARAGHVAADDRRRAHSGLEVVRSVILAFGKPTGDRRRFGRGVHASRGNLAIDGMNLSTGDLVFSRGIST